MNCAQRLIYNGLNAGRTAAIIASSVLPAERTLRSLPAYRAGSAALTLAGAYTGEADATFDVEIVDAAPTTPIISQPLLTGVGNGALSAITFTGTAQKFTLELVDAGLPTLFASVAFAGVNIVARASGAAGNGIALTVNSSGLTYTPLPFSLIAPLPKDTRKSDAVGLDFSAAVMAADNQFPVTAKRITFGSGKTQVYRQAKKWTGAKWEYLFEPPLQAYQPAGTRISEVTGTYTVVVTQGATTETFSGIQTNYDLLVKLNTLSALVRIEGVIANDRAADGQAAGDLTMRTDAYALPAVGSGSASAQNVTLQNVVIGGGAPTEIIELKCWAATSRDSPNAHLGAEIWSAKGSVIGTVGNFKTGDTISPASGEWSLVIPPVFPIGYGDARGEFSVRSINTPRTSPTVAPPICVAAMALGPDAIDQTVTLVYTKRPSPDCACDGMNVPDLSNSECLMGPNNPNSPGATSVSYPSTITARMTALWAFRADIAKAYTDDHVESPSEKARLDAALVIATLLEKTAIKVALVPAALTLWDTMFTDLQAQYGGVSSFTTGAALAAGDWVQAVGQQLFLATGYTTALGASFSRVIGRVSAAFTSGAAITLAQFVANSPVTGLSALTPGAKYAISDITPGTLKVYVPGTDSDGSVGTAINATALALTTIPYQPLDSFTVIYADRFQTRCDAILASAGISPLGKSDASSVSDDGCWQDLEGEAYFWAIDGSVRGAYLPAFNNTPYFSSRSVAKHNAATHEFAFQLNIFCPEKLKEGDSINLVIGNAGWSPTYQVGDSIAVSVIAAAPQTLAGGQNGNANQTWHVDGDVHGAFATFNATSGSGSYSNAGLAFTLTRGAIAFEKGSRFAFSAEGGHWRWRKNGGAWSSPAADIALTPVALSDGITATFVPGVAPSFNAADLYKFAVRQPNAPANVQTPTPFAWRWIGATATLDIDMGSATAFDAIAIARHTLPTGASVTVSAGSAQGASDALAATLIAVLPRTLAQLWDVPLSARWVRIAVAGASGGSIGWVAIAQAFRPSLAADVTPRLEYAMDRGTGINPSGSLLGRGRGCTIEWRGAVQESDYSALAATLDWAKSHGDEPILFFPSPSRADDSYIGKISDDITELQEVTGLQAASTAERRYSAKIGLTAVLQ